MNLDLDSVDEKISKAHIERNMLIEKMLKSDDIESIYKAQRYLQNQSKVNKKQDKQQKSVIVNPFAISSGLGYIERYNKMSFNMLRNMSRTWVIKSIIGTRVEQVCDFARPQSDKYSTGFVIKPKEKTYFSDKADKITPKQEKDINYLTEWVLNCGRESAEWHGDDFESFLRKLIPDCLALDQGTFEVMYNYKDQPSEWIATDGATYRVATEWDEKVLSDIESEGDVPKFVQVIDGVRRGEFLPKELGMSIRNPQTSIYEYGYGRSELEDMILTITSILNTDQYNANYFKIGSNPKGLIRVSGNFNQSRLDEFQQKWQAQVAGVDNAHKTPVIEADKMDFVSTQSSNKDMEYSKYYEFLIKIGCSIYKIDPSEIGFPMSGSSDNAPMFEGSNEQRLKHSKDKGLKPLLKHIEHKVNKMLVGPKSKDQYEFKFVGLEAETEEKETESDVKKVTNFETVNEIRRRRGLKDIDGGDIVLNPVFLQGKQMAQMGGEDSNEFIDDEFDETREQDDNPFLNSINLEETMN